MTTQNIYIIRHCDKDLTVSKDGCGTQGYERAKKWMDFFKSKNLSSPIFYAFGFKLTDCKKSAVAKGRTNACPGNVETVVVATKETCPEFNYTKCSSSQRAVLTICPLATSFDSEVITEFCTGKETDLVDDVYKQNAASDIVIVWEHNAIIDIFNALATKFSIKKTYTPWGKNDDMYNLLFTIPRSNNPQGSSGKAALTIRVQCGAILVGDDCSKVPGWVTDIDPTATAATWVISMAGTREMYSQNARLSNSSKQPDKGNKNLNWVMWVMLAVLLLAAIGAILVYVIAKRPAGQ